jgi:hypothetical protein
MPTISSPTPARSARTSRMVHSRLTGFWQRQVRLDLVAVAAAVLVLDDVPGLGEIGDDAVGGALGDARPGRDVAQPHALVVGNAQQHPGVIGQEAPVRHARRLP